MTNETLKAVYNGSELITSSGFTMQSQYIVPVLSRLKVEGLLSNTGADVLQTILSYKFDERKPFPSYEELSERLGKSKRTIKEAVSSIRTTGLLGISKINEKTGKACKNNVYDFAPFFALLEKFIKLFHIEKKKDIKIAELLEKEVETKDVPSFEWSAEYKKPEATAVAGVKAVEPIEEPVSPVCTLPDNIKKIIEFYQINAEGISAIEKAYTSFNIALDDTIYIEKIIASSGKSDFVNYFNTCITNAFATNEQPKQAPTETHKNTYNKPVQHKKPKMQSTWFEKELTINNENGLSAEIEQKILGIKSLVDIDQLLENTSLTDSVRKFAENHRANLQAQLEKERDNLLLYLKESREKENDNKEGAYYGINGTNGVPF